MIEHHPFRVALVRAFSRADEKELAEPLGIEALAAILRKNDIACRLFDRERDSMADIVEQIVAYNPSLLGLSVLMEDNALDAARLLLKIRQRLAVPCVIGGLFVTASYEQARAIFPKDCYLVRGEGETALLKICAAINGLTYPEMEKPYLLPEEWPWLYRYHLQDYLNLGAPINMKSSRGCPGQCRFCATPSLPDGLNRWRGRKIADVADEMEHLSKLYYPPAFNFVDDDFGPLSRVAELTEELKKRNVRCAFSLQLRAAAVYNTPNYAGIIRKLQAGGLCGVFIGVESFDAKTLAYFNKPLDPFEALRAAQSFRACGMAVNVGYLLWHPLATLESIRKEAVMLRQAGFFNAKICLSKLILFPGCALQKEAGNKHFSMPLEHYYEAVEAAVAPLYDAWLAGALDIPLLYCLAHLEPGSNASARILKIEQGLERINELAFQVLLDQQSIAAAEIEQTAAAVKERFHEISCAFVRSR